ncbi:hypothetical protein BgAZ_301930 [Babesia gibsoni]|uniref:PI3K/PI4K catalytic domain-containing protein n=1 Tax=Babesia gibsoni TaxID=33632 RepID=A0AAD8LS49_BABGI|nr:hypothetical protein BgAZ_301930 [Babesia gibsoni]
MEVDHVIRSYLSHKKQRSRASYIQECPESFKAAKRARNLSVLLPQPRGETGQTTRIASTSTGDAPKHVFKLTSRQVAILLQKNAENGVDRFISYLVNDLITRRNHLACSRGAQRLCTFVRQYCRNVDVIGVRVVSRATGSTWISKGNNGCHVAPRDTLSRNIRAGRKVSRTLRCCAYLKAALSGFRFSHNLILVLVKRVCQFLKKKLDHPQEEWVDIDIKGHKCGYFQDIMNNGANFVANVLCHRSLELPAPLVLQTTVARWRSFKRSYTKQMFHLITLIGYLKMYSNTAHIVDEFKASLNSSLNTYLFTLAPYEEEMIDTAHLSYCLYHFYKILNHNDLKSKSQGLYTLHSYNLDKMVSTSMLQVTTSTRRRYIDWVKWVIMIALHLLQCTKSTQKDLWMVIQILANFFLEGGLTSGLIRCNSSKACLRCVVLYRDVSGELYKILTCLRKTDMYPLHVNLIKILLKNEISKVYATFGNLEQQRTYKFERRRISIDGINNDSDRGKHKTPRAVAYAVFFIKKKCLKHVNMKDMSIKQKQDLIDTAVPYGIYYKLMFAVANNVSGVKILHGVDKMLQSRHRYGIMECLVPLNGRRVSSCHKLRVTAKGRLHFQGVMSLLAHIYINNKDITDCLSDLVIQNHLNVMQRTQSCHVLSKNLDVVSLTLPQLLQSLEIDPGDRVYNLLSLAMMATYVRELAPYFMASMTNPSGTRPKPCKAKELLERMLAVSEGSAFVEQDLNNIGMHSQLLKLTLDLIHVDPQKRKQSLQDGIEIINRSIANCGPVTIFEHTLERMKNPAHSLQSHKSSPTRVVSMDTETVELLKSATRAPFTVEFHLDNNRSKRYVYKMGDDTRQDALVVQIKVFMMHIFKTYKLETYLHPYLVVPYSMLLATLVPSDPSTLTLHSPRNVDPPSHAWRRRLVKKSTSRLAKSSNILNRGDRSAKDVNRYGHGDATNGGKRSPEGIGSKDVKADTSVNHILGGILEFIPGTVSRHFIGQQYNKSLEEYFLMKFGPRGSYSFNRAMDNFIRSLAGYSLLCFLLHIKDRNNGNLLISPEGHIIHIDFGFILGASPGGDVTLEHAPFKLTREMIDLMGGTESDNFHRYVRLLVSAYLAVRQEAESFISMVKLLEHSGMNSFRRNSLSKLKKRFYLDYNPESAANYMIRRIDVALHSKTTMLYDIVQGWQQGIQH